MRILLTTHAFLPRSVAGVEVYTARLAEALAEAGHTVSVLTAEHDLAAEPFSLRRRLTHGYEVLEVINPGLSGTLEGSYRSAAIDVVFERLLDELQPECVHAQHLLNLSTGLVDAAQRRQIPVLLTLHDYWLSCPRDGQRRRVDGTLCSVVDHTTCARCLAESAYLVPAVERGALAAARRGGLGALLHAAHRRVPRLTTALLRWVRRASPRGSATLRTELDTRAAHLRAVVSRLDGLLAPTGFALDRALEWGAPAATLCRVPLGAVVGPCRPRLAGARRRLGYVGTLAPHKGVHILLEAVRAIERADWTLEIIGNPGLDPAYTRRLEALAAGDTRIRFRGPVPPEEQETFWSRLDLLVLPSLWWENSPLTALEALAAGRPVIASRIGGVPEVIPEGAGVLVPPGDVAALRQTLGEVLEGRLLSEPLAPLPLKTTAEGAAELVALYEELRVRRSRRVGPSHPAEAL